MTDYFALLDQPRRPWLDPDEVKRAFHEKARHVHPDAQPQAGETGGATDAFAELNEAYQVLREPKRRLQHLLGLAGSPPARKDVSIPAEIGVLFPEVAALIQQTDEVLRKVAQATNALSRSLVRPDLLQAAERVRLMLKTLARQEDEASQELQALSDLWTSGQTNLQSELHLLYLKFSYLTRWRSELEEKQRQLAMQ